MEVTILNFDDVYDKVCESIDSADFLSFDTELTGLGRKGENRFIDLDTPEDRYIKMKNDAKKYTMIQFGLSAFKIDLENKRIETSTWCFYLNGQSNASYTYDSSSLKFLVDNGFNFNKLFKDGLSFMSLVEEEKYRKRRDVYKTEPRELQVKTKEAKLFVTKMTDKIHKMNSFESMNVPRKQLSQFHIKLLFNNLSLEFPLCAFQHAPDCIQITKYTTEKEKNEAVLKKWEDALQKEIGFALIGRKIMEANKPIVGHNPQLDVFQMVDKIVCTLPETYDEFKLLVTSNWPTIYDTKLISKDPPFATKIVNNNLENLYEAMYSSLNDIKFITQHGTLSYSEGKDRGKMHDAGYDAFITGICFLGLLKKLQGKQWMKKNPLDIMELKLYENKINLMFTYDVPYLDFEKTEPLPDRSHIFVVKCPETYNGDDIKKCFSDLTIYKTIWIDETNLYVVPLEPKNIDLSTVRAKCPSNVFVSMYKLPTKTINYNKHTRDETIKVAAEEQNSKRIKNDESIKLSEMTLCAVPDEKAFTKEPFIVPNDWK